MLSSLTAGFTPQLPSLSQPTQEGGTSYLGGLVEVKPDQPGGGGGSGWSAAQGLDRVIQGGRITARFHDTGSPAWKNQFKGTPMQGQHGGLDVSAPQGSTVFAPYAMKVIAIGFYDDKDDSGEPCCRYGYYVIGMLDDDPTIQWYSGHLQNVKIERLASVRAGQPIGETNQFAHTHLQVKRGAVLLDPEDYLARH